MGTKARETEEAVQIVGLGLANPPQKYSQAEVMQRLGLGHSANARFFKHDHIQDRHLSVLSFVEGQGKALLPTGRLLEIFLEQSIVLVKQALAEALEDAGSRLDQIDHICCVTSTGYIVPPLSAHFLKNLPLRRDCQRLDIVGMGCNAGVNGLSAARAWCRANPGKTAALICSEICSAIYDLDHKPETAIANSLFGDGVSVALLRFGEVPPRNKHARILKSESLTIPEHIDALRFNWNDERGRYGFHVDRKTPFALGAKIQEPIERVLEKNQLQRSDICHWVFHTGGAAILDLVESNLKLPADALRFSRSTLRQYGNLSSASIFFTYDELLRKGNVQPGDRGLMVAMGPGLAIEAVALAW